ncbi:MAG: HAD family hydrolase [Nitrospinaceae bacterium]|jgi:HAD superfamily hydrolase (TIGR01509 family)|nr:HAD family hydrolase [Nitrospinaceae bacterium]MBT3433525.1 HAD family hydrolase [Nitrospinaceae bacterium]MBT3822320.1 HAD family hydrolase [Nitrospinaceae bacterium]MBT4092827.1 HAD family hydrolase [Nitrospinaceae bacterium]MBT4430385.1 HAD family hydrolase [Nitrospinaceae bacterium]
MSSEEWGILLDFDGTLTKPAFDWEAMKNEMAIEDGTMILEYIETAPPERAREIADILERHETEVAHRAEPNEGAHELVASLREMNLPIGIVTNNAMRHVDVMLKRIELSFETIITRDVGIWKPDPRHVILGAEAIDVPPKNCIFIGDGKLDMLAAGKAGMTTIHLTHQSGPKSDYRVPRLIDAIPIIRTIAFNKISP